MNDLYMPPCAVGSRAFVQIDPSWRRTLSNKLYSRGAEAFAFLDGYELVMPSERSQVTNCSIGHVAVYMHMIDFGLRFPLDPFIVQVVKAQNIGLSHITLSEWRKLIAYAWTVRYKRFPETLNLYRKFHRIKRTAPQRVRVRVRKRSPRLTTNLAGVAGCPCIPRGVNNRIS